MQSNLPELQDKAARLPLLPGVYIMLDAHSEVIYVGKAKKLKNRVSSYFHGEHLPKVAAMVEKVADFNVIVAASEFEALVLENSLIKRHKPHYNILLKDDKGYPFIRVDLRQEYPAMSIASRAGKDGARYFGPFGGRSQTRDIINTVSKALLLPDCARKFPRDIGRERPCLNYHMGSCAGWCLKDSSAGDYRARIQQAVLILDGKSGELMDELRGQMEQAAEELRFERAAELRDRLRAIESLAHRQRVISTAFADTDAVGFCRGAKSCFTVLHFVDGDLAGKDVEMMDEPLEEDAEAVSDLVRQYYTARRGGWPKSVLLPVEIEDREELETLLSETAGRRVYLETPKRGERLRLIESAAVNAREEIRRRTTQQQRRSKTLEWLQKALELEAFPTRIEAFDISNLGDTGIVAAMTVHVDGKPLKRDYRKFRSRTWRGRTTTRACTRRSPAAFGTTSTGTRSLRRCRICCSSTAANGTPPPRGRRRAIWGSRFRSSAWSRTTGTAPARSSPPTDGRSASAATRPCSRSWGASRRRPTAARSPTSGSFAARAAAPRSTRSRASAPSAARI